MLDLELWNAALRGDVRKAAWLLSQGARVDFREQGFTPLLVAAQFGQTEVCKLLLEKGKANLEEEAPFGFTALNEASFRGHASTVALLLSKGAKVDTRNESGMTPLLEAADEGHTIVCELLLEEGKANLEEETPTGLTALNEASLRGHPGTVALLLSKGARVDTRNKDGMTPLLTAANEGHAKVCELLLANGSDLEEREPNTLMNALHVAAVRGLPSLIQLLLTCVTDINSRDRRGATPLHLASQEGHLDCVMTLLHGGADPLLPKRDGAFPIHMAAQNNHSEGERMLIDKGSCSPNQVKFFEKNTFGKLEDLKTSFYKRNLLSLSLSPCSQMLKMGRLH